MKSMIEGSSHGSGLYAGTETPNNQSLAQTNVSISTIIANTNPYFEITSGDGTVSSPYIIMPKTGVSHSGNQYIVGVNYLTRPIIQHVYLELRGRGSQPCFVSIQKTTDSTTWSYHYYFKALDHMGKTRWRVDASGSTTQNWFSTATATLYYADFNANDDGMYGTVAV